MNAIETSAVHRPLRRSLLSVAAAVAGAGVLPWLSLASADSHVDGFALVSAHAATSLAGRAPADLAARMIAGAKEGLERMPHFMPVVHTEGLLNGEGQRRASLQAQEDWRQACQQSLAFRLGGGEQHRRCAERYMISWIGGYVPSFNPIDERDLVGLLYGADLLKEYLPASQLAALRELCVSLAMGYLSDPVRVGKPTSARNNWHSYRVNLATAAAYFLGDAQLIARARGAFERHVMNNIDDQGASWDFMQRDALHYVVFMLEPMLQAAAMAAAHGDDWFNSPRLDDRLRKALIWLEPYALGQLRHQEYARTTVEFDRRRAQAGVAGFSGEWRPDEAASLYWLAAQFDARFNKVSAALAPPPAWLIALYLAAFSQAASAVSGT